MKAKWKSRFSGVAVIAALAIFAAACSAPPQAPASGSEEEPSIPVKVQVVKKGALSVRNEIIGVTMPSQTHSVMPKLNGELAEVRVSKGDHVQAGDVLGVLDTTNLQTQNPFERDTARTSANTAEECANFLGASQGQR